MTERAKTLLAACRRIAPDFTAKWSGDLFIATCTIGGEPHELSMKIGGAETTRERVEVFVLDACYTTLKPQRAA